MSHTLWYIFLIIIVVCTKVVVVSLPKIPFYKKYRLIQKLPGPKGILYFGNLFQTIALPADDALFWFKKELQKYDRLMRMWFATTPCVYIKDPDDVQALFSTIKHANKGIEYLALSPWLEDGLLTSTTDTWHARRKLLTPAFHFKILEDNLHTINKCSKILCKKLKDAKENEVNIESYVNLCTLDIIMGTAMGIDLNTQTEGGKEYLSRLKAVTALAAERTVKPLFLVDWIYKFTNSRRKFYALVKYLHDFSSTVINQRKKNFNSIPDSSKARRAFLDQLLHYASKNPTSFCDKDIRKEVDTFMFEGHDTTSVAIIYALYNLATHADIQDKVYQELTQIFGSSDRDVTSNDLNKMIYLEKVIKETLRLYPSVPMVSRNLDHDLILNGGVIIPAGTNVISFIYMVHRNEKYWEDPEKFDPERFSENQTTSRHPFAYIPFSAGPRNCIGQKFAMMELKTVLSTIIRRLQIVPVTYEHNLNVVFFLVLRTKKPIICKFILR